MAYHKKIGIIGGGSMGEAFIGALVRSGISDPSRIWVSDVAPNRLEHLRETYFISVTHHNYELFTECNPVIIAVKPQHMGSLLAEISRQKTYRISERKLVISIAAGIPIQKIENFLYPPLKEASRKQLPIIRVMPNTPALVLSGISGISPNRYATDEDMVLARNILSAMGAVVDFDENDLDAVTALSGSGPAYVFYLIESMIAAGIAMDLDPEDAKILTMGTLKGALALLEEREETPESLRRQVTSPGGTTEAALKVLESHGVKQSVIDAILSARDRAKVLSDTLL